MGYHTIYIPEDEYYEFYQNHIQSVIMPKALLFANGFKKCDHLIISCRYKNGNIDKGRHLSPIYKTITFITENSTGLEKEFSLIHFK